MRCTEQGPQQLPVPWGQTPASHSPTLMGTWQHTGQWAALGNNGTQSIPFPSPRPSYTHPSPAPLVQLRAGPGWPTWQGGAGQPGGEGSQTAAPWCPGWPGLALGVVGWDLKCAGGAEGAGLVPKPS